MITLYLTWDRPSDPAARIGEAERGYVASTIRTVAGVTRGLIYTPASAHDPYLNDGPPPPLAVQLYFTDVTALEAACAREGALQALAHPTAVPSLSGAQVTQQPMLARAFPVDDAGYGERPGLYYLVSYPGPADDLNLWLDHYIANHPAIMRRFPGIRGIEIDTRIDATSFLPFERVSHIQRNKTVFDSPEALNAALNSPVRHEMRADFHSFPPFGGGTTHFPHVDLEYIAMTRIPAHFGRRTLAAMAGAALLPHAAFAAGKDSLTIAYPVDVPSWDPTSNTVTGAQSIYKTVFDQLLQFSPELKLQAGLVKEWGFEGTDGKRLAITLRDGLVFHDGSPLTTEDIKFSFLDRPTKDPTILIRRMLPPIAAIEIASPTKAVIVFSKPSPAAPIYLGFLAAYILPKAYIASVGEDAFKQKPIGAGPYRLVSCERGSRIVLEAFDRYWGGEPKIKHVTFQLVTDPAARVAAIEAGRADMTSQISLREIARLSSNANLKTKAYPYSEVYMIQMPDYVPALTNEDVRVAMALAIDKVAISKAFYGGYAVPISVFAAPGSVADYPGFKMEYDKPKALELMAKAGYSPSKPLQIPLISTNGAFPNDFEIARAIASMWKQIGVQADIQEVPLTKYVDMNHSGTLPGPAVYSWSNPTGDPENTTGRILDGALPFSAWKGKEATDRVHALLTEVDPEKRMQGYRDLNRDAALHGWSIALLQSVFTIAYSKDLNVVPYQGGYILPATYSWAG